MNAAREICRALIALGCLCVPGTTLYAGPTDPVTVSRPSEADGATFAPGTRSLTKLPGTAYVEEEYFVEGAADLFNYAHNPPHDAQDIVAIDTMPYKTRLIVRRPVDAQDFSDTVVVEWWNSTAGFDTAPAWDASAAYFKKRGIVYVGVTNSATSIGHLVGGCRLFGILPPICGNRYATLHLPENGLAYEMMSQIANLLKGSAAGRPLPADFKVARLFHVGESQQAGSVITYASAFHLDGVNDGYFIQSGINARVINFGLRCGDAGVPAFPDCTPRLAAPHTLVTTELEVPVYQVITQTDFETLGFGVAGRQPDTRYFRYYEVPGGAHNAVHRNIELIPAGLLGPQAFGLADLCAYRLNTTADGPVYVSHVFDALWTRMSRQSGFGGEPPTGLVMDQVDGLLQRDAFGNVTGGVRLPAVAVPTARYVSTNSAKPSLPASLQGIGNLACRLSGSVFRFDDATLESLYPNNRSYVKEVRASVAALQAQGLLLRSDAARTIRAAQLSRIGRL